MSRRDDERFVNGVSDDEYHRETLLMTDLWLFGAMACFAIVTILAIAYFFWHFPLYFGGLLSIFILPYIVGWVMWKIGLDEYITHP